MLNAIRYMARSAGGWRMLPTDFGPWQTVYWWFRRFVRLLLFRTIHDIALMMDRERVGREASPIGCGHRQMGCRGDVARSAGMLAGTTPDTQGGHRAQEVEHGALRRLGRVGSSHQHLHR